MIIYPLQLGHPLVSRQEYLTQQQKCSLLADVGSQMAKDWQEDGEPGNKNTEDFPDRFDDLWTWIPRSTCDVDEEDPPLLLQRKTAILILLILCSEEH